MLHLRTAAQQAQPEALRLAALLEQIDGQHWQVQDSAAAELRRLHAERTAADGVINDLVAKVRRLNAQRDALLEALKTVEWHGGGSCWVVDADKIDAAIKAAEENTNGAI